MPSFCCVLNCSSRGERDLVSFFRIPTALNFRFLVEKNVLSKLRREMWLAAINRADLTESKLKNAKVCSKHFITGKPAALVDKDNPDWIPCVNMGYSNESRIKKSVGRKLPLESQTFASMPGKRCSVSTCNNSRVKTGNAVVYHTFPRNKNVRDIWIKKCRRGAQWNANSGAAVCSVHFTDDDYQRDLKAELLNLPRKPKLKPTAIPSLNMNSSTNKSFFGTCNLKIEASNCCNQNAQADESNDHQYGILQSRDQKFPLSETIKQETQTLKPIQEIETAQLCNYEIEPIDMIHDEIKIEELDIGDNSFAVEVFEDFADENTVSLSSASEFQMVDASTQTELDVLEENQKWFFERINKLESELRSSQSVIMGLQGKIVSLEYERNKVTTMSKEQSVEHERLKEGIGNILSQSQIDYGILKNKNVIWTPDDISKAFTIRYFNSRCYMYLKDTLKYPLPDVSSLQRWLSKINLKQGILSDVFRIMKIAGYAMTDFEKNIVLQLGEIQVRSLYEYDEILDDISGPHSTMQVIMARGLFSDWKQPIYIGFDTKITEEVLMDIIEQLHEITYNVVACTSNSTKINLELWKELAINTQDTFFLHPVTNDKIYFFVDSSYLLLLLHKWFVTTGFVLEDGVKITKDPLEQHKTNCGLTQKHLEVVERHNIELACQVFSPTCVTGLKDSDSGKSRDTRVFIEKISSWFDLMTANLPSKKPYGCDIEIQNQILDSVYHTIKTMRCEGKNNMVIFQKGMLVSINSLKQFFSNLKKRHSDKNILASRLNSDSLEDLLSQISKGRIPSPLESVYKIRNLLLGDDISQGNISERDVLKNEYILTKALTANVSISNPYLIEDDSNSSSHIPEQVFLKYLPAWIATKYKDKYPELGYQICKEKHVLPSWLRDSSENLIKPSEKWLEQTELINQVFNYHIEYVIKKRENVAGIIIGMVTKQYEDIPKEVVSDFVTQRMLVKIKYHNIKLQLEVIGSKRKVTNEGELVLNKNRKNM